MPDAVWNTTTGPPGPTLLYDPPFVKAVANNFPSFTSATLSYTALTWDPPVFHGIPFASVSGTDITFLCDCAVIVSLESVFFSNSPAEGNIRYVVTGSITADPDTYFGQAWNAYSSDFNLTTGNLSLSFISTTPPSRVVAGSTLGYRVNADVSGAGSVTDDGSQVFVVRVA